MTVFNHSHREILQQFKKDITKIKTIKGARKMAVDCKRQLKSIYKSNSLATYLVEYRKVAGDCTAITKKQRNAIIEGLRLNKHTQDKLKRRASDRVMQSATEPTLISEQTARQIVEKAENILESNFKNISVYNHFECTAALIVLTGRRITEITKTGEITPKREITADDCEGTGLTPHQVGNFVDDIETRAVFTGQLKTKGRVFSLHIPTLTNPEKVANYLQKTREWEAQQNIAREVRPYKELSKKEAESRSSKINSGTVNRLFGNLFGCSISSHDLRKFYAAYVYYKWGANKNQGPLTTYILGHLNTAENNTFKSYLNFKIVKSHKNPRGTKKPSNSKKPRQGKTTTNSKNKSKTMTQFSFKDPSGQTIEKLNQLKTEWGLTNLQLIEKLVNITEAREKGLSKAEQIRSAIDEIIRKGEKAVTSYLLRREYKYIDGKPFSGLVTKIIREDWERINEYNDKKFPGQYKRIQPPTPNTK